MHCLGYALLRFSITADADKARSSAVLVTGHVNDVGAGVVEDAASASNTDDC